MTTLQETELTPIDITPDEEECHVWMVHEWGTSRVALCGHRAAAPNGPEKQHNTEECLFGGHRQCWKCLELLEKDGWDDCNNPNT